MVNLSSLTQLSKLDRTRSKPLQVDPSRFSAATLTGMHLSPYRWSRSSSATRATRSGLSIQLNLGDGLSSLNSKARQAVFAAARFWEKAIKGSITGAKKIVINIKGDRLSRGTLAVATPTKFDRNVFPVRGVSTINNLLSRQYNTNAPYLQETMIHEFAHVLGIGTLWGNFIDPTTATYRADSYAGRAYGELLGSQSPVAIPLEPTSGDPSLFYHWSEAALGNEIMTPIDNGRRRRDPVSLITLGALQDLGWTVNNSVAQPYTLP